MPETPWGPDVVPHALEEFDVAASERAFDWHVSREYGAFDAAAVAWTDDWWPMWYLKDAEPPAPPSTSSTRMMMGMGI